MKKLLNTLYVTTPNAYISKDGQNIVVSVENEEVFRIPAINIQAINTFGYQGASPGVMKLLLRQWHIPKLSYTERTFHREDPRSYPREYLTEDKTV